MSGNPLIDDLKNKQGDIYIEKVLEDEKKYIEEAVNNKETVNNKEAVDNKETVNNKEAVDNKEVVDNKENNVIKLEGGNNESEVKDFNNFIGNFNEFIEK